MKSVFFTVLSCGLFFALLIFVASADPTVSHPHSNPYGRTDKQEADLRAHIKESWRDSWLNDPYEGSAEIPRTGGWNPVMRLYSDRPGHVIDKEFESLDECNTFLTDVATVEPHVIEGAHYLCERY